jgi:hypothetical protein
MPESCPAEVNVTIEISTACQTCIPIETARIPSPKETDR